MAFSINTNLGALKAYNALAKVNAQSQKAQYRLATGKRINSVADDTSGFAVGKALQSKAMIQKSQLNNAGDAQNYLSTAETALLQINDLITDISVKYADSQDASKSKDSIANDIRSIASEIDSILKTTKYNNTNLLAQADGSALASNDVFDAGSNITMDFASSAYLDADLLTSALHGDPGVMSYTSETFDENTVFNNVGSPLSSLSPMILEEDGVVVMHSVPTYPQVSSASNLGDVADAIKSWFDGNTGAPSVTVVHDGANSTITFTSVSGNPITSIRSEGTFDLSNLGISLGGSSSSEGGLMSDSTDDVLSAASNVSTISSNVKSALGRIGNLTQTLDYKRDFLTASITNSTSSVSRLFDTDMAAEQLNAAKSSIASNAATSMLSQLNMAPQNLLQLLG